MCGEGTQLGRESRVEGDMVGTWRGGKLGGWVEVPQLLHSSIHDEEQTQREEGTESIIPGSQA